MRSLAPRLRQSARAVLPERAFLRRDREDALFVSDAPRRCPEGGWADALARAGFDWREAGGLIHICPGSQWLRSLEADYPEPPDAFCASLLRFRGMAAEEESLALFALAARRLDGDRDGGKFEKRLRQRAAECLRLNSAGSAPPCGGGLYACALARHLIIEEGTP